MNPCHFPISKRKGMPRMLVRRRPPDTATCLLIITLVVYSATISVCQAYNCLGKPEVNPKRYLTVNGKPSKMQLGVSKSITHQLVTHVLKIYLTEVLGYTNITLNRTHPRDMEAIIESFREPDASRISIIPQWPKDYVNLQVWMPPDYNHIVTMEASGVSDVGNIGPPASFGLYVVTKREDSKKKQDVYVSWRDLSNAKTARKFRPVTEDVNFIIQSTRRGGGSYHCNERSLAYNESIPCENGIYTPPWCQLDHSACALLISNYVEMSGFLWKEIEGRGLYVQMAWVGEDLESLLTRMHPNSTVLLAEATMEPIVLLTNQSYKLTRIQMAPCDNYTDPYPCHLYNNRLAKLIPTKFRDWAGPAYETLLKIDFDSNDYKELVNEWKIAIDSGVSEEKALVDSACHWLRHHEHGTAKSPNFWSIWSTGDEERRTLMIAGIFPLSKESSDHFKAQGIFYGATMAKTAINKNDEILRDHRLELLIENGQCQADLVLKSFIDFIRNQDFKRIAGILGPACSDTVEPLVGVAKHYKTVVISYSAEGSSFTDRNKYPYFFRTIGENKKYKYVYLALVKYFQWKRVTSLTQDGTKYTEYIAHLENLFQQHDLKFTNKKFATDWTMETMKQYLENLRNENKRVIIADMNDEAARAVMCEAYKKKMTGRDGYVWFLPLWLSDDWYNTSKLTNSSRWSGPTFPCTTSQMIQAIDGHLSLSHAFFGPDNSTMQENKTVHEWRQEYKKTVFNASSPESNYAGFAYDAVWVYAYALDKLIKKNHSYLANLHDEEATRSLVDFIQKTDFNGVSGRINFKNGSSRDAPINVIQWFENGTRIIATFTPNEDEHPTTDNYGTLEMYNNIIWLTSNGKTPWDGTPEKRECLLSWIADFLGGDCELAVVISSVTGCCILLLAVILAFYCVKKRYDKKAEFTKKIINALGIEWLNESNMFILDQWEIPRENVVINRRLGEGAFGTVYGGEAYFKEKGWVPVAVKTLKVGSTTEEKLDFLSEAEVMKHFEHKNIVKLLGVCTKNEPIYNVMEFMLYGDLKTFLLARRHMVNEKYCEDSDEVSSKKLTQMALDVARALSYLDECKYVHRDVASRNCLINSSRVVKLGDFGMTRPILNECYEFNRRGMLPVRWMAPESLSKGIFTHKSDIWSYGVLLYEIITFGSFPFQGMSNNQVLDYVKQGQTLTIPDGVKPHLESLLKECWRKEPVERPDANEIIELLVNNQKLLTPCLDVPLKSVIMEDTDQLEISMEKGLRRRSQSGLATTLRRASTSSLSATNLVGTTLTPLMSNNQMPADASETPLLYDSMFSSVRDVFDMSYG